jgi:integrase
MKITTKQVQNWLDGLTARCKLCKHLTLDKAAQCKGAKGDGVHPPLAQASRCKIRNSISALYTYAIQEGFFGTNSSTGEQIGYNPIRGPYKGAGVKQSAKRVKQPNVLSDKELSSLLGALELRERTLVRLANIGLRRSELQGFAVGRL